MRLFLATDAWRPQINGVVRTLEEVISQLHLFDCQLTMATPGDFRSAPMPGYPEIRISFASPQALTRRMVEARAEVVHIATEGPIGLAARLAALRLGLPLTTSYHTRFPEYLRARAPIPLSLSYAALRRFHSASSAVLVATPSLADELGQRGFRNLRLWSRGVDLSNFKPRSADMGNWPRPVFLNVGRLAVEKNLDAFLSLDLPGAKVVVGDGPQRAELQARYPEAIFLGALAGDALAEAYAQADVFVFPSRTDTFGIVILEALASGLPVAAYPVTGPRDIIASHGVGALSEDLRAASLACLALSPKACVQRAKDFSWDAAVRQFVGHIRDARAQKQGRSAA